MTWIWNLHWRYILINEALPNVLHLNAKFIAGVKVNIFSKKLLTRKYFEGKLRDHIHGVSIDPIYQEVSSM